MIKEIIMSFIYKFIVRRKCPLCGNKMEFASMLEYPSGAKMIAYTCSNCKSVLHSPYTLFNKDKDIDYGDLDE